ncbi:Ribose-phosphate pyrophosphokinase 4 [Hibiscus syriacus]|uniref:Ribose-phosphate pyrophosphokinase 4 n=1 Tax=Hibiscus syriacus TaxID=106335 RepID=A0A6A2XPI9_HIBSY|nr:Ribose-phosphate pyrophosphokinase 4 [Hibiscus syriacus]
MENNNKNTGEQLKPMHKKHVFLFYCVECEELARKVAAHSHLITLQSINWRSFDDGFPNLYINNALDIRGQHVAFLASFSSPAVIFEQLSVIYNLPRLFVASFTLVLPFFPTGSFERMEEEGDVATAFTMARILSNIPISRGQACVLSVYVINFDTERFYFGDHVLPLFETGISLLKQRLHQLPDADKIVVAFPDDGAWKRFQKLLDNFPTVICTKVREGDKRIVRLKEGNPADCHVVIVDDLVQLGGTLIDRCHASTFGRNTITYIYVPDLLVHGTWFFLQKVLLAHGAAKVSAYVTHGVFPKCSWERFTRKEDEQGFAYFWITDSCPHTVKAIENRAPFEVLSLAESIADALQI